MDKLFCIIPEKITRLLVLSMIICFNVSGQEMIKVGMSSPFSGPSQIYGIRMKLGIDAWFNKINNLGGIDGRELHLEALDDGYMPELARKNMEHFIKDSSIIAVIGNVGAPTANVTVPMAKENKILLFGLYTGAGLLRKIPPERYVINYRASYEEEMEAIVDYLISMGVLPYEIAFFTQNDSFGDNCYQSSIKALESHGFINCSMNFRGVYERNTSDITDAIITFLKADVKPHAFIMAGTYLPSAMFIRIARKRIPDAIFAIVSAVDIQALASELGKEGEGVIIAQVVPDFHANLPLVKEYLSDLENFAPGKLPCYVSLEGYIVAKIFTEGLRNAGKNLTRESVIDGILEIRDLDIGMGSNINYSKDRHQGSDYVRLSVITKEGFEYIE